MHRFIGILTNHALCAIRQLDPGISESAARRILDVHLDPHNFPMPVQSQAAEAGLLALCNGQADLGTAAEILDFEPTREIHGIVRVLARTHINRQGVGDVTRGAQWKSQSPRVMKLFEGLRHVDDFRAWLDHRVMIDRWLSVAESSSREGAPVDVQFDIRDVESLHALRRLSREQARRLNVSQVPGLAKRGWGRVVLGLHTGVMYLEERFAMSADRIWAAVDSTTTAQEVATLSADARMHVTEFGPALSASFFADLGSEQFIKPDVHVVDVASAALGGAATATPEVSVAFVRRVAAEVGLSPRAVDKLMFLACSQKFYLAGLPHSKRAANGGKADLLARLRRWRCA